MHGVREQGQGIHGGWDGQASLHSSVCLFPPLPRASNNPRKLSGENVNVHLRDKNTDWHELEVEL